MTPRRHRKRQAIPGGSTRMRLGAVLFATLLLAGCADQPEDAGLGVESGGPAWSFTGLDGNTYSRDAPEGNATVLFFMASWCSSCRSKAPVLAEVQNEYAPRGVRVYSLDFDPSETEEDIRGWQERYQQDWPHGIDEGLAIQRAFGVKAQSSVVVLDADGEVVEHFGYGQMTGAGLREALEAALAA